jgi:enoyl-CoA hydratase/carnithine racemase
VFDTVHVEKEGAILVAEVPAPPMNLLGPALVRDLVSPIQQAEADDSIIVLVFRTAYFISKRRQHEDRIPELSSLLASVE